MSVTHPTDSIGAGSAHPTDKPTTTRISRALHPTINLTPIERVGRVVLGALAALSGLILLVSAGSVAVVILEVLLIVAGLDLVVTGALGHCPLYNKLGYRPSSLRRPS